MENNTALTLQETHTLGKTLAASGFFPDAKQEAQAVVKVLAGRELGLGPIYSMTKVYIVKGKVMIAAEIMGAMIKKSGRYDYQVKTLTNNECLLVFTDNGKSVYESTFTMEDAKRADLLKPDSGWMKWPRPMLFSKALSQGARIVCPHLIAGAYTPEDFGFKTDESGEIITPVFTEVKAEVVESTGPELYNEEQRKAIFSAAKNHLTEEQLREYIKTTYAVDSTKALTKAQASSVIDYLNSLPIPEKEA
jgi:hypothetical protein